MKSIRLQWIDFVKGIAILLVIVGHTIDNYYIRTIIFSFHMPLFFFLSGYTFNSSKNFHEVLIKSKKSFLRLIVPAYTIWIMRNILYYFINGYRHSFSEYILSALYASGVDNKDIPAFGMMWFLVALFITRVMYDIINLIIHKRIYQSIFIVFLCICGIFIGQKIFLPLSIDIALVSLCFFACGLLFREYKKTFRNKTNIVEIISVLIWGSILTILFLFHKKLELAYREYPCGFLSIVMAIFACVFICLLSEKLENKSNISCLYGKISSIGRHSMLLFSIHAFDTVWQPYLDKIGNKVLVLSIRIIIDLCIFSLILYIYGYYKNKKQSDYTKQKNL